MASIGEFQTFQFFNHLTIVTVIYEINSYFIYRSLYIFAPKKMDIEYFDSLNKKSSPSMDSSVRKYEYVYVYCWHLSLVLKIYAGILLNAAVWLRKNCIK